MEEGGRITEDVAASSGTLSTDAEPPAPDEQWPCVDPANHGITLISADINIYIPRAGWDFSESAFHFLIVASRD